MKQPKKLKRTQKEILSRRKKGINVDDYGVIEETKESFTVIHRITKEKIKIEY